MFDRGSPKNAHQKAYVRNYHYSINLGMMKLKGNCFTAEETVDSAMRIFNKIAEELGMDEDEIKRLLKKSLKNSLSIKLEDIIPTIGGD